LDWRRGRLEKVCNIGRGVARRARKRGFGLNAGAVAAWLVLVLLPPAETGIRFFANVLTCGTLREYFIPDRPPRASPT